MSAPEFEQAGTEDGTLPPEASPDTGLVFVILTHVIFPARRREFLAIMHEAGVLVAPVVARLGGDHALIEDRGRPNYFLEVFRFPSEARHVEFDDWHVRNRKLACVSVLLEGVVDEARSDFRVFVTAA